MKTVLVIGNGGREHAIAWKLSQSSQVSKIFVAQGNPGIAKVPKVEIISLDINDVKLVADWCKTQSVDLVAVGPEVHLTDGIADALKLKGIACFGPTQSAARIESSKSWSKRFMDDNKIPTARWQAFTDRKEAVEFIKRNTFNGYVIKASGLAAGKGVFVTSTAKEAVSAVDLLLSDKKFGSAGDTIIIEEKLEGQEVSVLAFTDGSTVKLMLPAQDHKRAFDDDKGNNTGGMGAYCPCPIIEEKEMKVAKDILEKAVKGLKVHEPFVGVLYAGLMLVEKPGHQSVEVSVLEFNCRFGDPETEVILPLLETDLFTIMQACCAGNLSGIDIKWKSNKSAVGVVMASKGYPESSSKGDVIQGIENVDGKNGVTVFHSGTALSKPVTSGDGTYVTNGGRVLIAVAVSDTLSEAAITATNACKRITFDGAHFRSDIAHKGIARNILQSGSLTYKLSGVDITAGDDLVNSIKSLAQSTTRPGVKGSLGGFGALFDLAQVRDNVNGYTHPLIVSSTDGVGTKLKIAEACNNHKTIGIDLVAMCVNDILAQGAQPLFFLDYFATSKLDVRQAADVIGGIAEGCRQSNCALVGGETAEMPGLYAKGDYDLAGFTVGVVEEDSVLPRSASVVSGDVVIAVPSSGVHSNGFSLVRRIVGDSGLTYDSPAPFSDNGLTIGEELLVPTRIYIKSVLPTVQQGLVKAIAHITGGGLLENIPRVLPKSVKVVLDASKWNIPRVFAWLAVTGGVCKTEMLRTFNCGVGLTLIVSASEKDKVLQLIPGACVIGAVAERKSQEDAQVEVNNFEEAMSQLMQPFVKPLMTRLARRKRVAVLISGNGTNLQAIIDGTANSADAKVVLVISNKADAYGIKRAEDARVPSRVIAHTAYKTREAFEEVIDACLREHDIDIVCLAGFMRILTGWFVKRWRGRLLNVHPALLPSFRGAHAVRDALAAQVRVTGSTVHFVEEEVDTGCIVGQEAVAIDLNDTEETLFEKLRQVEHRLFPKALLELASGRVRLDLANNKLIWSR